MPAITRADLVDFLNDTLPADRAAAVERAVRDDPALQALAQQLKAEAGPDEHTVGAIWRRERLSCPTRETLASYLQDVLPADHAGYVKFHLGDIGCPFCQANLDDLTRLQAEPPTVRATRRKRIVDSSAGVLRAPGRK